MCTERHRICFLQSNAIFFSPFFHSTNNFAEELPQRHLTSFTTRLHAEVVLTEYC